MQANNDFVAIHITNRICSTGIPVVPDENKTFVISSIDAMWGSNPFEFIPSFRKSRHDTSPCLRSTCAREGANHTANRLSASFDSFFARGMVVVGTALKVLPDSCGEI